MSALPDDCPHCGTRHYGSPIVACVLCGHAFARNLRPVEPDASTYTGGAVCTTCNGSRVRDGAPCVCTGEAP